MTRSLATLLAVLWFVVLGTGGVRIVNEVFEGGAARKDVRGNSKVAGVTTGVLDQLVERSRVSPSRRVHTTVDPVRHTVVASLLAREGLRLDAEGPQLAGIKPGRHLRTLLEPSQNGPWRSMDASAYALGCECPFPVRRAGKIVSCGKRPPQRTKAGVWPVINWSIAAHPSDFPIGAVVELSYRGILTTRIVHDLGEDITPGRLDLYMSDCRRANEWGHRDIWVREVRRPLGAQ